MRTKGYRAAGLAAVAMLVPAGWLLPGSLSVTTLEPSSGTVSGTAQTVVTLGDSVPAGTACGCEPYGDQVAQAVADSTNATVTSIDDAVPGLTSAGLLNALAGGSTADDVAGADLVIVEIGANDYGVDHDPADMTSLASNVTGILDRIHALTDAEVVVVDYWNVLTDGSVAAAKGADYVASSDALTEAVNAVLQTSAQAAGDVFVEVRDAFAADPDDYLAADGDHPNATGHEMLAATVEGALGLDAGANPPA